MRMRPVGVALALALLFLTGAPAGADVGDPQLRTDHPWYPGELACSTFERLFRTQAEVYARVTGRGAPRTDEEKALASWLWRNTHYWHGEEGTEDLWGKGFTGGGDLRTREYWTGLFAHGFGLCGTTHSQWTAEFEALLGHGRARGAGVAAHNSFEVFLTGGPYGSGKWALLDHDISTVIFNREGTALLSIAEVQPDWRRWTNRNFMPERQRGWLVCGLDAGDGGVYARYDVAEYLPGYAGPPPMVRLRRGETFRRYLQPGLADGKTFVFWGRNSNTGGIPGPERSQTWVNQPERMYRSTEGAGYRPGQARYANAVFTYRPDFRGPYREGIVEESDRHVVFEFSSPYVIGATPPNDAPWGVYDPGGRNGLVLRGKARCAVALSVDRGRTWQECGPFADGLDLTDRVKGRRQYRIRFGAGARELVDSGLTLTTVCQANAAVMPRLREGTTQVTFLASGRAVVSAGPNLEQARTHLVEGAFGTPRVTLEPETPRGEPPVALHAAAHVLSGNPPSPDVKYAIEVSTDGGRSWKPVVQDWTVPRRRPQGAPPGGGPEPRDFWSQSFCWGSVELPADAGPAVRVRFRNDGGKAYARCEAHLVYRAGAGATKVTFAWTGAGGARRASHTFPAGRETTWSIPTGRGVTTRWVEMEPAPE